MNAYIYICIVIIIIKEIKEKYIYYIPVTLSQKVQTFIRENSSLLKLIYLLLINYYFGVELSMLIFRYNMEIV